ncbi:MAG TPA: PilZ domain-containing protein [Thermodesulfobacteriota bacterium]|nr:PilZ domain-containing protein [Thermodesulfobacteriota bacterium]
MENSNEFKERRRYPRSLVDLPFEYRMKDLPDAYGGLVVNASEGGLLIHSVKDMPVGLELRMVILFPNGYELAHFEVLAQIIWKGAHSYNNSEGFQYGLKFVQILDGDRWKLMQLLSSLGRARSTVTFSAQPNNPPPE